MSEQSSQKLVTGGAVLAAVAALGFSVTDFVRPGIEIAELRQDLVTLRTNTTQRFIEQRELLSDKTRQINEKIDKEIERMHSQMADIGTRMVEKSEKSDASLLFELQKLSSQLDTVRGRIRENERTLSMHNGRYELALPKFDDLYKRFHELAKALVTHTHHDDGSPSLRGDANWATPESVAKLK